MATAAGYERNTDKAENAVAAIKASDAQAIIVILVNKPSAAFAKRYRESGGSVRLYNISVVDPAKLVKLAGLENVHGLGISQVVPYLFATSMPVVRQFQELLKKYAPGEVVNYTSFEEFVGAKVLVEALRRAGSNPTRARVVKSMESMNGYDTGGITVGDPPANRIGSRFVDVTVVGRTGKLLT